jgi:signal transduction histidine kinase
MIKSDPPSVGSTQSETEILYQISSQLNRATTPEHWLEAVSVYARQRGAVSGYVLSFAAGQPNELKDVEVAASWILDDGPHLQPGQHAKVPTFWYNGEWPTEQDGPTLLEDAQNSPRLSDPMREFYTQVDVHAVVFLPQQISDEWVSVLAFHWRSAFDFDAADRRIFQAIMQLSSPVMQSIILSEQERTRIRRAEIVGEISSKFSKADSEKELLAAISDYSKRYGSVREMLFFLHTDTRGRPQALSFRSEPIHDLEWFRFTGQRELTPAIYQALMPDGKPARKPFYVEDVETLEDFPEVDRQNMRDGNIRASVILPLRHAGIWQGMVLIHWSEPHIFTDDERYVYDEIMQWLPPLVAIRRAYLIEQSIRSDREMLLNASQLINAAHTYQDMLQAIATIDMDEGDFYLYVFENYNHRGAGFIEVVGSGEGRFLREGQRLSLDELPFLKNNPRPGVTSYDDVANNQELDEVTRSTLLAQGVVSNLRVGLVHRDRVIGALGVDHSFLKRYTPREKRLMAELSELVAAAVERIRLQQENIQAKEEANFLYKLAERVNSAVNYQDVVDSIYALQPESDGVFLSFFENMDIRHANATVLIAASGVSDTLRPYIRPKVPITPVVKVLQHEPIWISEDFYTDPRFDEETRDYFASKPVRAGLVVPLRTGELLWGVLTFYYHSPRPFSERDRRIMLGIGDLVQAAIERIQSQMEANQDRMRAEILAKLNGSLLQATDELAILSAIVPYAEKQGARALFLNYKGHQPDSDDGMDGVPTPVAVWLDGKVQTFADVQDVLRPTHNINRLLMEQNLHAPLTIQYHEDVTAFEGFPEADRADWGATHLTRGIAVMPLYSTGRFLGTVEIVWFERHIFTEEERYIYSQLLQTLPSVVGSRRAYLAEQEAREENSLLYQVSEAVHAATTFPKVLQAIRPLTRQIERIYLILWENLNYETASFFEITAGVDRRGDTPRAVGSRFTEEEFPISRHLYNARQLAIENMYDHPLVDPVTRTNWERGESQAFLQVALMQNRRWYGVLSFESSTPRKFLERERRLTLAISDLVLSAVLRIHAQSELAAAAEAQRLAYLAEQEAREESISLYRVSEAINAANTFHEIVRAVAQLDFGPGDIYLNIFEDYDYVGARYFDIVATATDMFNHEGQRWWIDEFQLINQYPRQGVFVNEFIADNPIMDEQARQKFLSLGVYSNMRVSLWLNDRWLGGLGIDSPVARRYTEREKRLMTGVGDLVSAAVERIRLQQETVAALSRAEQMNLQIQRLAALEERTRLARELHDSVSQALYGIGLGAQTAYRSLDNDPETVRESVEYVLTLAEAGMAEMRALIFELRPESLETEGLAVALAKQGASIQARHGIEVHLDLCDEPDLEVPVKESLYRVVREALHNVVKHANASQVTLRMFSDPQQLRIEVDDNGVGFRTEQNFPGHLGLHSMRERMIALGGTISIESGAGQGTRLALLLPYHSSGHG